MGVCGTASAAEDISWLNVFDILNWRVVVVGRRIEVIALIGLRIWSIVRRSRVAGPIGRRWVGMMGIVLVRWGVIPPSRRGSGRRGSRVRSDCSSGGSHRGCRVRVVRFKRRGNCCRCCPLRWGMRWVNCTKPMLCADLNGPLWVLVLVLVVWCANIIRI